MEKGGYSLGGVASRSAARSGGIGIDRRVVFSRRRRLLGWRGKGEEAWSLGQRHGAGWEMEITMVL